MQMREIAEAIEAMAPLRWAATWDNPGWQIGDPAAMLAGVLLVLDVTPAVVAEARTLGANLIVAHHPLFFHPIKRIDLSTPAGRLIADLIRPEIAVYAAHTNLDVAPEGVSGSLARVLDLGDVAVLEPTPGEPVGMGAVGTLPRPMAVGDLVAYVREYLGIADLRLTVGGAALIRRFAVCGGSGSDLIPVAARVADAFLTSDVRYHRAQEAQSLGLTLIDADHYATERPVLQTLAAHLRRRVDAPIHMSRVVTSPFVDDLVPGE